MIGLFSKCVDEDIIVQFYDQNYCGHIRTVSNVIICDIVIYEMMKETQVSCN